ncbi:MAG: hypothetical protein V2I54_04800 [Bacteroidales bacterium]|jgi:hypothetical protein|nr:hypothetical protein [Bacteroidales bacterium]
MKKKVYLVIFLFLVFWSCGPYIWFKSPQPEGRKNLQAFPNELIGKYTSSEDHSVIIINKKKVIKQFHEELFMSLDEFQQETGDTIAKDTSFLFTDNWHIKVKVYGDSVVVFSWKDEVQFELSEDQLLRKYRDYYFLNSRDTGDYWKVKILSLRGDTLEYADLLKAKEIEKIKSITSVTSTNDTSKEEDTRYYLDPNRRELRRILRTRTCGNKFFKAVDFK